MQRTILIADDDNNLTLDICSALEEDGYSVRVAQSCEEVKTLIATEPVGLMVLSQDLPDAGGLSLLKWLREEQEITKLPTIMLAAEIEENDVFRAWEYGVDSFQSKRERAVPLLVPELRVKIKRIFKSLDEDAATEI